ncbi:thioesterase family protein [Acinetobacter sp. ANC 4648]|uniref:thioesterase family protein n=1 Tax=Acinetobacter sp. ANC 4648 TaxID=1977875 RepID=UPI000A3361DA|nr:thioesterase family protein [Acinetobacter sp. ANC 4648]OTG81084.1 thioesterase [Acinetobacter sp. ANC 4648]
MSAYYQLLDRTINDAGIVQARYQSTMNTQGAWNPNEQHMSPATGVICVELEKFEPRENMRIGRISFDIFGLIALGEIEITTQVIRPGKTIELIESIMTGQGKTLVVARTWRMMIQDSSFIAGLEDQAVETPENMPDFDGIRKWPGRFTKTVEARSSQQRHGKGLIWLKTDLDMVEGETASDFVNIVSMVDMANGIVPRQSMPLKWGFPNLDLQLHFYRLPEGKWLGLEAVQQYGADGIGLTSAILHDVHGPFGRSEQILTLRKID